MPVARVNKIDIYYEVHGHGDPVVCIPGLGSDANTWAPVVADFQHQYKIVILENRGSGRSSKPHGYYSTEIMAQDAVALMEHLGITRAHILGKSMGGMIAQIIGALYPDKVRSLVLSSTLMKHDSYGEELLQLARVIAETGGLFLTYRQAFLMSHSRQYCIENRKRLAEVEAMLKQVNQEEMLRGYLAQSLACEKHDSRPLAGRIHAPSLVIVGKDDVITPPEASRELAVAINRSELVILSHGGHGFWREFAGEVNKIVGEFLLRN